MQDCETLISEGRKLRYLAEGNANVIFRILHHQETNPSQPGGSVLRLRKDLSFTRPCIEVNSAFRSRIVPLFEPGLQHLLLQQTPTSLTPTIVEEANAILIGKERNGTRSAIRCGTFLPAYQNEPHGIVMPDLCQDLTSKLIEFKPKWLLQSPSAPSDAVRCRTCALNGMRRMKGGSTGRGDSGFCPLNLLSQNKQTIASILLRIDPTLASIDNMTAEFMSKVQPALQHLKTLQKQHNSVGLQDFQAPEGRDFSVAMALRDCSCFLVIDLSSMHNSIRDVKFADLDLKSAGGGKLERWAQIEDQLISSGAYTTPNLEQECALHLEMDVR